MSTTGQSALRHKLDSKEPATTPGLTALQQNAGACRAMAALGSTCTAVPSEAAKGRCSSSSPNGSLRWATSAAAVTAGKLSNSLQRRSPSNPAPHGMMHSGYAASHHHSSMTQAAASNKAFRSSSTPKHCSGAYAGLTTSIGCPANPVPGRAKVVAFTSCQSSVHSSMLPKSASRVASMGLTPALVAKTDSPNSASSHGGSRPAAIKNTAGSSAASQQASSRTVGLTEAYSSRLNDDAAAPGTLLKQDMQTTTISLGSGTISHVAFDAVAAEQQQRQQQGRKGQAMPAIEALTCPGATSQPQRHTAAGQTAAVVVRATETAGSSSTALNPYGEKPTSHGLCSIRSPSNDGFLDRLHVKARNAAAAAASAGTAAVPARRATSLSSSDTPSSTSAGAMPVSSSLMIAVERLKALSHSHRQHSRSSSTGAEVAQPSTTSSRSSSDDTAAVDSIGSRPQPQVLASTGMTTPCSSRQQPGHAHANANYCSALETMQQTPCEALLAHNRGQLEQALPGLAGVLVKPATPSVVRSRSYSSVAATAADSSMRQTAAIPGQVSSTSSCLNSGTVHTSGSRMHRQSATGRDPAATDSSVSATRATNAGPASEGRELHPSSSKTQPIGQLPSQPNRHMQAAEAFQRDPVVVAAPSSLASAPAGNADHSQTLYCPPSSSLQQPQRLPVYDPARYAEATAVAEAVQQRSSAGGNVVGSRSSCLEAAAICTSPFGTQQQASSSHCNVNGTSRTASMTDSSQVRQLSDDCSHGTQQQQQQSNLPCLASTSSHSVGVSRQPSYLIGTQPFLENLHADDTVCAAAVARDATTAAYSTAHDVDANTGVSASSAEQQARQEFLTGNLFSRANSVDWPAAAEAVGQGSRCQQQQHQQQQQQGQQQSGPIAVSAFGCYSRPSRNQHQQHKQQLRDVSAQMSAYPDSDSDVSEMSSSLEQPSSSNEDSDSDEGGISAAVAARRRLVGSRVTLGSSISVSSADGRSSSCGSGTELDGLCNTAKPGPGSLGLPRGHLPQGCVGLHNLGNTCFMNSILQCLNCLPELVIALLGRKSIQRMQRAAAQGPLSKAIPCRAGASGGIQWHAKASVGPALHELFKEMWSQQQDSSMSISSSSSYVSRQRAGCAISPRRFLYAVAAADDRWGDGCQQDSQEFLHSLLEQLQSECNRVLKKPQYKELSSKGTEAQQAAEAAAYARSWHNSLVDDLFGGLLQSTVTCSSCQHQSHCFDPFLDLSVPIPNTKQVSVQDCLSAFVEQEVLSGSEQVKCALCSKTCDATKRLQIYAYPQLLVLTLKRFNSCNKGGGTGLGTSWFGAFSPLSKNQTPVKLDGHQALDLSPYCNANEMRIAAADGCTAPWYQLVAVSEHSGCLGGGHYTAQGTSIVDGCWYQFNDSSVTPVKCPSGSSSSAYVLFYRLMGA